MTRRLKCRTDRIGDFSIGASYPRGQYRRVWHRINSPYRETPRSAPAPAARVAGWRGRSRSAPGSTAARAQTGRCAQHKAGCRHIRAVAAREGGDVSDGEPVWALASIRRNLILSRESSLSGIVIPREARREGMLGRVAAGKRNPGWRRGFRFIAAIPLRAEPRLYTQEGAWHRRAAVVQGAPGAGGCDAAARGSGFFTFATTALRRPFAICCPCDRRQRYGSRAPCSEAARRE
jgi:hypothetical protein